MFDCTITVLASGNKLASFTNFAVTNSSSADDPSDATLESLAVAGPGGNALSFDYPEFDAATLTYYLSVANDIKTLTVLASPNAEDATVAYLDASNNTITDRGAGDGLQAGLAVGANTVKVEVTSEDGNTTRTYTIHVGRAAEASAGTCDVLWCANLTVGTDGEINFGYANPPFNDIKGGLAPYAFTVENVSYTVKALIYGPGDDDLYLTLDRNLPEGNYVLNLNGMEADIPADGSTKDWAVNARTSRLGEVFGELLSVKFRERSAGTVELTVTPETVHEGSAANPGDTSVTWTVTATTSSRTTNRSSSSS